MRNEQHVAVELWRRHHPRRYPRGVLRVPKPIPGLAFFPGGYGLWNAKKGTSAVLPPFPRRGVMVLGHDFHSESGYNSSLERGCESETQPTWLNLLKLLRAARVPLARCFFTNFYMGLRQGDATTGLFPGSSNNEFAKHCGDFFIEQLKA